MFIRASGVCSSTNRRGLFVCFCVSVCVISLYIYKKKERETLVNFIYVSFYHVYSHGQQWRLANIDIAKNIISVYHFQFLRLLFFFFYSINILLFFFFFDYSCIRGRFFLITLIASLLRYI